MYEVVVMDDFGDVYGCIIDGVGELVVRDIVFVLDEEVVEVVVGDGVLWVEVVVGKGNCFIIWNVDMLVGSDGVIGCW